MQQFCDAPRKELYSNSNTDVISRRLWRIMIREKTGTRATSQRSWVFEKRNFRDFLAVQTRQSILQNTV